MNQEEMKTYLQWQQVKNLLIIKQQKPAVDLASDLILSDNHFKTMFDNEEIWYYEKGVYTPQGITKIKKILQDQEAIKETICSNFVSEVVQSIIRKTYIKREDFEAPINLICVGNGVYDLNTAALIEHSPDYYFKSKIETNFIEDADCPEIKKFIKSVVEEKYHSLMFEIPAYLLYRKYSIQKAIMLNGTNDNGKSVYIRLLEKFIGQKNYSSEELQEICHSTFSKAELFGKLMNSCADLPATIMEDTGDFKKLTAFDTISAQRKFGQPFQYNNYAKLIFSANEVPESKDLTDAFFKRWIIIDFPYKFVVGLKEEEIKDNLKIADPKIIEKITTQQELEGLLRESLRRITSLIENGCYSVNPPVNEIKQRYLIKSNSAVVFIETELTDSTPEEEKENKDYEPVVEKEFLWSEYLAFCKHKRTNPKTLTSFYLEIKTRWAVPTEKRVNDQFIRKNHFVGIRYLGDWRSDLK
jgi:P4 family phage/plasmid primase-like protien